MESLQRSRTRVSAESHESEARVVIEIELQRSRTRVSAESW